MSDEHAGVAGDNGRQVRPSPYERAAPGRCPRCGEDLPATSFWQRTKAAPGRRPAWRLTHPRAGGDFCTIYAGDAIERDGGRHG